MLLSLSCGKTNKDVTVIKDCTGSYLRLNDKDYKICNDDIVANLNSGTEVVASFKKVDDCEDGFQAICEMYHAHKGWIKVTEIE